MGHRVTYILNTNEVVSGANKNFVDLFNDTTSGHRVYITGIRVRPKGDVAVTGALAIRLDRFRTSSAGVNGTSIGYASAVATAATIIPIDSEQPALPSGITAQLAPATPGTARVWLGMSYHFSEETNAAIYETGDQNVMLTRHVVLNPGQGLSIRQGSVASVNSYVIEIHFEIEETE